MKNVDSMVSLSQPFPPLLAQPVSVTLTTYIIISPKLEIGYYGFGLDTASAVSVAAAARQGLCFT